MPRLFTGIEIPQDVGHDLMMLQGGIPGARWIDPGNFHITLRFVGDVSEEMASDLFRAMDGIGFAAFQLQLKGLGYFGGRKPHSIHALVAGNDHLVRLQVLHERLCQGIGLKPEPRKFTPHVTLARLRGALPATVNDYVARNNLYASRPFAVERFVVFSSRPSRGGGPYAVEESYDLRAAI